MQRDLKSLIQEYDKCFGSSDDQFYISDVDQLIAISGFNRHFDILELVSATLKAGFMVGYKKAKGE